MAIDQISERDSQRSDSGGTRRDVGIIIAFVVMALLAISEIHTLNKVGTLQESNKADQTQLRTELTTQVNDRLAAMETANAQAIEAMKTDLDNVGKRTGSTQVVLRREKAKLAQLEDLANKQADELKQEISAKADEKEVGALTQDVSSTRSDLDSTKKTLDATRSDLGMARSEFGTLIARNHDQIEELRKLGDRDILKKNRTVNEPIFFYTAGSKRPFELTINSVQSGQAKGYISTPKGATSEVASRGAGSR